MLDQTPDQADQTLDQDHLDQAPDQDHLDQDQTPVQVAQILAQILAQVDQDHQDHQDLAQLLLSFAAPTPTTTALVFAFVLQDSSRTRPELALPALLAVPMLSELPPEDVNALKVFPTTTESAQNVLLELSGAQLPQSASLSVVKTQLSILVPTLVNVWTVLVLWEVFVSNVLLTILSATDTALLAPSTLSTTPRQQTAIVCQDSTPTNTEFAPENAEPMKFTIPTTISAPVSRDLAESVENAQFVLLALRPLPTVQAAPTAAPTSNLSVEDAFAEQDLPTTVEESVLLAVNFPTVSSSTDSARSVPRE